MKKRKTELYNIVLRLAAVMLILVIFTTSIVSGRYARYVTSAEGSDDARVAKFTVSHSILQDKTDITKTIPMPQITPGETVTITIQVKQDTEVTVRNTITVDSVYDNLPLTIEIKEPATGDSVSSPFTAEYVPGNSVREYLAEITWVSDGNDEEYMGMVDLINITVTSEQVD